MFLARRPTGEAIERFLADSRQLPLSYASIGIAQARPAGYDIDEAVVAIGRGLGDFNRAKAALAAWKQFDIGWAELVPRHASIEPGTVVAVIARHLGFWSLHGCRVVYQVGSGDQINSFGVAYGTLSNHAEVGEEIFEVSRRPDTDEVFYRIRAVSKPRALLARFGYPITRALQARFRRDSAAAMKLATAESGRTW